MGNMEKTIWVGIDVGKQNISVAIDASKLQNKSIPLEKLPTKDFKRCLKGVDSLVKWIEQNQTELIKDKEVKTNVRILMEHTGCYSRELVEWLKEKCPESCPLQENGSAIHYFKISLKQSHETDRLDARAIARYGVERNPVADMEEVPEHYKLLQELIRERDALIKSKVELENRKDSLFSVITKKINQHVINDLNKQIKLLDKEIKSLVVANEDMLKHVHIMTTSPGVSFLSAVVIIAELGPLTRFRNSRQLSAYSGLMPRIKASGTSVKKTVLSRRGSPKLRQILYLNSIHTVKKIDSLAVFYDKLLTNGKSRMSARCACMRKHLLILRAMVVNNTPFDRNFKKEIKRSA